MKKQEFTTSQERKLKFAEAGILFALVLALTVFIGAKVVTHDDADVTDGSITVVTEPVEAEHPAEIAAVAVPESVVIETAIEPAPEPISEPIMVTYAMAEGAYLDRDYAEAARLFTIYTAEHRTNAWGHYMLGLSEWKAGDLDAAEEAFITALEIKPDHSKSLVNYGRVLIALDRPADAQVQIELALAADPESSDARRVLGRIQHASGELDRAAESYLAVLNKRGDDAWSLNNLGLIRIEQGRYDEALAPLAKAASIQPETACIMNNLGVALERTGHFGDAARAFEAALEADESYAKAEISLARVEEQEKAHGSENVDLIALAEGFTATPTVAAAEEAGTDLQAGDMEVASAALSAEAVAAAEQETEEAEAASVTGTDDDEDDDQ